MRVCLERRPQESNQVEGRFFIYDDEGLFVESVGSLELPWLDNKVGESCIPAGIYRVIKHQSPRYGECFWVKDVPGRSEILIHDKVNFVGSYNPRTGRPDLKGCIAPFLDLKDLNGDDIQDIAPKSSTKALEKLLAVLPDEFELEIHGTQTL